MCDRRKCRRLWLIELKADHPRMHALTYAWSLPVTWKEWRSRHLIRHMRKTPCHTHTLWLHVLQNRSYGRPGFYIAWIFHLFCYCDLDLDPMTFIYETDLYSLEIYRMRKYELSTSRLSKVIAWRTDRQTDLQLYHDTSRVNRQNPKSDEFYVAVVVLQ